MQPKLGKGGVVTLVLQMQNIGTERRGDFYSTSISNTRIKLELIWYMKMF